VLTEFLSNNAVAVIYTPVAIQLAERLGHDPRPFVVAVMFSATLAFATPVGYQTNMMVYGRGMHRTSPGGIAAEHHRDAGGLCVDPADLAVGCGLPRARRTGPVEDAACTVAAAVRVSRGAAGPSVVGDAGCGFLVDQCRDGELQFLTRYGLMALREGGLVQMLEIGLKAAVALAGYLVFKAVETELIHRWRDAGE
jgi:hypothetical protein